MPEGTAICAAVEGPVCTQGLPMAPRQRTRHYHARQGRTSTRQKPIHCDTRSMVHDISPQRSGRTQWPHAYGHSKHLFHDQSDAVARQAAATDPPQLRLCNPLQAREPLGFSWAPTRNAESGPLKCGRRIASAIAGTGNATGSDIASRCWPAGAQTAQPPQTGYWKDGQAPV